MILRGRRCSRLRRGGLRRARGGVRGKALRNAAPSSLLALSKRSRRRNTGNEAGEPGLFKITWDVVGNVLFIFILNVMTKTWRFRAGELPSQFTLGKLLWLLCGEGTGKDVNLS